MKARIIRIGNSRGLRIPKAMLEEAGLEGDVEMHIDGGQLIVSRFDRPRAGWEEAFERLSEAGDAALLDRDIQTRWEEDGWEWPLDDSRSTS